MLISTAQQQQVTNKTRAVILQANHLLTKNFPQVEVLFDLRGRSAGQFRVRRQVCEIRFNPQVFALYFTDNLINTVPHEVAHYLIYLMYPRRRQGLRKVKPHGVEWRELMAKLGADASVCHNYDLTNIPQRREQHFSYSCNCREHQVSCRRHNKIQAGRGRYYCRYCKAVLKMSA
ncbi:MAG: SprT-like domain-containing protein [Xanthomonadales bacterium]|nr:SprT-like domain-containing protein [Xanthomonadales bacterium]